MEAESSNERPCVKLVHIHSLAPKENNKKKLKIVSAISVQQNNEKRQSKQKGRSNKKFHFIYHLLQLPEKQE